MFLFTSAVRPLPQQSSHSHPRSAAGSACPSPPVSDADKNEICLFFIRRHCSFKGRTSSSYTAFRAVCIALSEHSFVSDCLSLSEESLGIIFFAREVCPCPLAPAVQMAGFQQQQHNVEGPALHGGCRAGLL